MMVRPRSSPPPKSNRKGALLHGDSVPKPLGFTALPPEWFFCLGRLAPPRHSGRWVGAPVASLRCRIFRPGEFSIRSVAAAETNQWQKSLPDPFPVS
jgi:hypothetical protein